MAGNAGRNVIVAYKAQASLGTPASGSGADAFEYLPSAGGTFRRNLIQSELITSDGQSGVPRLGVREVQASYETELFYGGVDKLFEAVMRGAFAANVLKFGTTKTYFTVEQYGTDIDESFRMKDCIWNSFRVSVSADAMARVSFGLIGRDADAQTAGAAPIFTSPTVATGTSLVGVDGVISVNGSPVTDFTAIDFGVDRGGGVQATIGTTLSADTYVGNARGSGNLTQAVTDLSFLDHIADEDVVSVELVLTDPDGNSLGFELPRVVFGSYQQGIGQDAAQLASSEFGFGKDPTDGMLVITRTPAV